jgi:hypothetical protein
MPDTKITALAAITTVAPANDLFAIVDVSDNSMAASGTTKNITTTQILGAGGTATLASATITGDLTVDTNVLKVDSANDKVGFGTTSPFTRADSLSSRNTALGSIAAFNTMPLSVTDDTAFATGVGGGLNFRAKLTSSTYNTYAGIWSYRESALNSDYAGSLIFGTSDNSNGYPIERFRISSSGVATWSVGGSTAMTLNSTGLGVGGSPVSRLSLGADANTDGSNKFTLYRGGFSGQYSVIENIGGTAYRSYGTGGHIWYVNNGTTEAGRFDGSGNLLVGTTSAFNSARVSISGAGGSGGIVTAIQNDNDTYFAINFRNSGGTSCGSISCTTSATAFNISSDYRLKESVQPLTGGLTRINALKPSVYKWKVDGKSGEGFIAHELADVVPAAVTGEKDAVNEDGSIKPQQVDLSKVVPILVAAIKELAAEVNALKNA